MSKKIITIIIPIFNRFIKKKSISNFLKFKKFIKIIIIDDGSPKKIMEKNLKLIKKFPEITYYYYKNNKGQSHACNQGLKKTFTKYVWFFDDDDYVQVISLKKILSEIIIQDEDGFLLPMKQIFNNIILKEVRPCIRPHDFNDLRKNGQLVSTSCSIFKTSIIRKIKGWDENLYGGTDTDLFLRFSKVGTFKFIKCKSIKINLSQEGRLTNQFFRQMKAKIFFLRKHWKDLAYKRRFYYIYSMFVLLPLFYGIKNNLIYLKKKCLKIK